MAGTVECGPMVSVRCRLSVFRRGKAGLSMPEHGGLRPLTWPEVVFASVEIALRSPLAWKVFFAAFVLATFVRLTLAASALGRLESETQAPLFALVAASALCTSLIPGRTRKATVPIRNYIYCMRGTMVIDGAFGEALQFNRNLLVVWLDALTGTVIGIGSLLAAIYWLDSTGVGGAHMPYAIALGAVGVVGVLITVVTRFAYVIREFRGGLNSD